MQVLVLMAQLAYGDLETQVSNVLNNWRVMKMRLNAPHGAPTGNTWLHAAEIRLYGLEKLI